MLGPDYLGELFPAVLTDDNLLIDGRLLPTPELRRVVVGLAPGEGYTLDGSLAVARLDANATGAFAKRGTVPADLPPLPEPSPWRIGHPSDLFLGNARALHDDFSVLTTDRTTAPVSTSNTVIGPPENFFLEAGVTLEGCTVNCTSGPVYIGKDAVVLEGSLLRGPLSIGAGALIKMGAKLYGGTTVGPNCKVGGEVTNVIFQANSNKGHDGYLGNSVIGEWCNLGADTNASNLKNDYGEVRVWSYVENRQRPTGLQFHGLIMGDHGKAGINTMFNTGTVVGFSANVFGAGFLPTFLPSFSWGGLGDRTTYRLDKAIATATRVMQRRGHAFSDADRALFTHLFGVTQAYRELP